MKIAIPTRNNRVDNHFGHCELYTIITVSDKKDILNKEIFTPPQGCGCKSDLVSIFREKGVTTMLAGSMGAGAINKITSAGIDLYRGCSGEIEEVTKAFLSGQIVDSGDTCHHHHHGHR